MQSISIVCTMHCLHCFLYKIRRRPSERFKISKDMHIRNMCRAKSCKSTVCLSPRSLRSICCERLTVILIHCIKILIKRKRSRHNRLTISIVSTKEHWRFVCSSESLQAILHSREYGLCHPLHIIIVGRHCLTKTHEQANVRIVFYERLYGLVGIIVQKRSDWAVTVLCLYSVMLCERF